MAAARIPETLMSFASPPAATYSYDGTAKLLHWTIALLLAALYIAGLLFDDLQQPLKGSLVALHMSFGIVALALIFIRLARKPGLVRPAANDSGSAAYERLVSLGHVALYILMFVVPVTGLLRRFVRGRAVEFFGWQIPSPFADLGAAARPIAQSHGLLAHALAIVVGLHVLAALWHHFGKRDNVLKSMLPGGS